MSKNNEKLSWMLTFVSDLSIEFTIALMSGALVLLENGDISQAAVVTLMTATATATLRTGLKKALAYLKTLQTK
jgi:hypothetical protein